VAAVIRRNGHYLICRRPAAKRHGGLWEFPGGKLHDGETVTDGVTRELAEELHVVPTRIGRVQFEIQDSGSPFTILFVEVEIAGEPRPTEHEAIAWVHVSDLPSYALAPSDQLFAQRLTGS
jgi:mutator protein MutT